MKTKIRLQISKLLNELFDLSFDDSMLEKVKFIEKEWNQLENKILNGFLKITGLNFRRNYIDVF